MIRSSLHSSDALSPEEGLKVACELFAFGLARKREQLRADHRDATEAEIEDMVRRWLQDRPGARDGDGDGRPATWPRS